MAKKKSTVDCRPGNRPSSPLEIVFTFHYELFRSFS